MARSEDDRRKYHIQYNREKYRAVRNQIIAHLGGKCAKCGSVDSLQIDHIDPSKKSYDVSQQWASGMHSMMVELEKCQALCVACHSRKSAAESSVLNSVDHGGGASGKRNCKCVPCKARKNEYMKAYKANRRIAAAAHL